VALLKNPLSWLFCSVCLGATGQLLLKTGVKQIGKLEGLTGVLGAFRNPKVLAGFAMYGISSLIYLKVLEKCDLSYAYPLIASSYVIVVLLSYFIFHEAVPPKRVLGLLCVCVGVYLIGSSKV